MRALRVLFLNSAPLSVNIARGAPSSSKIRLTNAEYTDWGRPQIQNSLFWICSRIRSCNNLTTQWMQHQAS